MTLTNPENSGFNNFRLQHNVTQTSENLFIDTGNWLLISKKF